MKGAIALLMALALSGCAGGANQSLGPVPALNFSTMTLDTVPLEPWEARGVIRLSWSGDLFGVYAKGEDGMPTMAVRQGDVIYTTDQGMGWTKWQLATFVQDGRGFRYEAWDLRGLLAEATLTRQSGQEFVANSQFVARGTTYPTTLTVQHDGPLIQAATIATGADAESPYTLRPTAEAFPFSLRVPAKSVEQKSLNALHTTAGERHALLLSWVDDYVDSFGSVPSTLTPDSLALQRLNKPWPVSPFDRTPMAAVPASGHFAWTVCSANDAQYAGYGLDGELLGKSYGRGCSP